MKALGVLGMWGAIVYLTMNSPLVDGFGLGCMILGALFVTVFVLE